MTSGRGAVGRAPAPWAARLVQNVAMSRSAQLLGLWLACAVGLAAEPARQVVGREELLVAMRLSQGFDPTATANGARLQAEVLLRLAQAALTRAPQGPPLFIDHATWFEALLARVGVAPERAPLYARLAHEHGQDTEVDYRAGAVIETLVEGPAPRLAANVTISWPARAGAAEQFQYEDALSSPRLEVTMKRVITYRLVDYGDMLLYAEIQGLRGRPTTGVLGALFNLLGEVPIVENRMALSSDGLQISRGRAKKGLIDVTTTVTLHPDGRAEKGLPAGRPDLVALEERLKRRLKIAYKPFAGRP